MRTKRSTLAGTWYPDDPRTLGRLVDSLLAEAPAARTGPLRGLIVPHAGYQYSGPVAAAAYRLLRGGPYARVVLLAPSHRLTFHGVALLDVDAFETPLGPVRVDAALPAWRRPELIRADPAPFHGEHSLEIQLPFVQRVLGEARVVPLLFGDMAAADYVELAATLEDLADRHTVFVVSSDFTHYGWRFGYQPFPADDAAGVRARLRELDLGAIEPVLRGDAAAFAEYVERTGATVCGRIPVTAFLTWSGPRHQGELLAYRTSLDVTGDYEHCVSYAAIAFPRADAPARAATRGN